MLGVLFLDRFIYLFGLHLVRKLHVQRVLAVVKVVNHSLLGVATLDLVGRDLVFNAEIKVINFLLGFSSHLLLEKLVLICSSENHQAHHC